MNEIGWVGVLEVRNHGRKGQMLHAWDVISKMMLACIRALEQSLEVHGAPTFTRPRLKKERHVRYSEQELMDEVVSST